MRRGITTYTFLLIVFFSFFALSGVLAQENETEVITEDDSDSDKIAKAYQCLEDRAGDCSGLTTQEVALTILATPDDELFDSCVSELFSRESGDNWGNVRDSALAVLALDHAGEDTKPFEEWLLSKEKNSEDLVWYLEQDSDVATSCSVEYDSQDFTVAIGQNKKIDRNAGSCLTRAQANFWFEVDSECYGENIAFSCDQDFITALLYKNRNTPTIYVLEGTERAPAFGTTEMEVSSKCFGDSSCSYEASAYATLALLRTGHEIEMYVPYLIALADTNEEYLPEAFVYIVTNYPDYATSLVEQRTLGNYWEAKNSAYDRFYDTALALIALRESSSSQIQDTKDWLLFSQSKSNGCWQNSVRDTAMILWALEGRAGRASSGGSSVVTCGQGGFFCIPSGECESSDVLNNYHCSSISSVCCALENLKTCSEFNGEVCSGEEVCIGNEKNSIDSPACCTGRCEIPSKETECEAQSYTCSSSCFESEEEKSFSCTFGDVCCGPAPAKEKSSGGLGLVWILTILILVVMIVIAWIKREALKLWWFGVRNKFRKDKGPATSNGPGQGPRGGPSRGQGLPRRQYPMRRPAPARRGPARRPPLRRPTAHSEMDETFKKLQEMSGK